MNQDHLEFKPRVEGMGEKKKPTRAGSEVREVKCSNMVHFVFKKKKDFPKNSQFFITVTCVWFEEALVIFTVYKQI